MTDQADDPMDAGAESRESGRLDHPIQLLLLRHADAGDPAEWHDDDALRPLSGKGRRQARWVGRWLSKRRRTPDVVVTSPKVRAAQTAALATEGWGGQPLVDERLAGGFAISELAALLADRAPEARRVMLVGHDPDFSELASDLVGGSIAMPKGATARIDLAGPIAPGTGVLRWLVPAEAVTED